MQRDESGGTRQKGSDVSMASAGGRFIRISCMVRVALRWVLLGDRARGAAPYAAMVMDARTGEVLHSPTPTPGCTPPR